MNNGTITKEARQRESPHHSPLIHTRHGRPTVTICAGQTLSVSFVTASLREGSVSAE